MTDSLLGTMFTFTTYGTWLRGDARGWVEEVEDGRTLPANRDQERAEKVRMKHAPYAFNQADLYAIGEFIGASLRERMQQRILAMALRMRHVHFVVAASACTPPEIAKCAKDAVRYGLRPGRPIWTDDYDKRWCFTMDALFARMVYVERHNLDLGLPAKPWPFIEVPF